MLIIKLLEENIDINLCNLGLGNSFSDMTPKIQVTKENTDKLNYAKIQNFHGVSNTIRKEKRQATKWEKISAKHISDKGPTSGID